MTDTCVCCGAPVPEGRMVCWACWDKRMSKEARPVVPKKYRKRPVTVEAIQWTGNNYKDVRRFAGNSVSPFYRTGGPLLIWTLKGNMIAATGDYIIKGIRGELYPCKPEIFRETYEEVDPNGLETGGR